MSKEKVFTIGIAGGSGCGKSAIAGNILDHYGDHTSFLRMDNYYKKRDGMSYEERCKVNFDSPEALDMDLIVEHVKKLQNWEPIECPVYDFKTHNRSTETVTVQPNKILLIEGLFALSDPRLLELEDTKIFVDVDADVRVLRRLRRDVEKRGRSVDSVISQYLDTVKPMYEKYIAPTKSNANVLIPQGGFNKVAINMIIDHLRPIVENRTEKLDVPSVDDDDEKIKAFLNAIPKRYQKFYQNG